MGSPTCFCRNDSTSAQSSSYYRKVASQPRNVSCDRCPTFCLLCRRVRLSGQNRDWHLMSPHLEAFCIQAVPVREQLLEELHLLLKYSVRIRLINRAIGDKPSSSLPHSFSQVFWGFRWFGLLAYQQGLYGPAQSWTSTWWFRRTQHLLCWKAPVEHWLYLDDGLANLCFNVVLSQGLVGSLPIMKDADALAFFSEALRVNNCNLVA